MSTIGSEYDLPTAREAHTKQKDAPSTKSKSELGKDDFLQLLILQLQHQDPTNPMEDRDFIAQMANFSSLEQMANLNKSFNDFAANQSQNALTGASELIGKYVTYASESGMATEGKVVAVFQAQRGISYKLEDGTVLSEKDIVQVSLESSETDEDIPLEEIEPPIGEVEEDPPVEEESVNGQSQSSSSMDMFSQ
ncbi:flagellar hook assembly protein FlgD [Bacillaceae bacterium SIJ1]|uniref:flagellar hook assembly protein FlgD n=1 Tax=Litoribacterium kuwaitense TaxID=1398745 RepID=UPI0013E9AE3F|nr:flagellar hook assembly protein FlgD [Litoribacterium kuwaitense]NGP44122.1 flagellar hook assembly protein FlgD [Litoribacterium kuwaitense]